MSQAELVGAYLAGQMSRRTLIRRLVAGGVSAGAAISYAQLLNPATAGAQFSAAADDDLYPYVEITVNSTSLATVTTNQEIVVHVLASDEIVFAHIEVFLKLKKGLLRLGKRDFSPFITGGPGERNAQIPIATAPLAGRSKAKIVAQITAADEEAGNQATIADGAGTLS